MLPCYKPQTPEKPVADKLREVTGGLFDLEAEESRKLNFSQRGQVKPEVSVICPTTEERLLFHGQLYGCFKSSTRDRIELIVVDTGLNGPSPFFLRIAALDSRVVYRHYSVPSHQWSVGLKRNLAVHLASGDIIAHFDDDDIYAPEYLDKMVEAMQGADAVTLSCWYVLDVCTGFLAHMDPLAEAFYDSGWAYGYGFSYVYKRNRCLEMPFSHAAHFAEDTAFLRSIQRHDGRRVKLKRDDMGLVLHIQHGGNLSNSHAHREVSLAELEQSPLANAHGFEWYVSVFRRRTHQSPYITLGVAYVSHLRPSEHKHGFYLSEQLRSLGVVARSRTAESVEAGTFCELLSDDLPDALACIVTNVRRCGECFTEPGRLFGTAQRYMDDAVLPGDVPRMHEVERLAILHVARMLLRRSGMGGHGSHKNFHGVVRLSLRKLSSVSVISLCAFFTLHFPGLRLEVDFVGDSDGTDAVFLQGLFAARGAGGGCLFDGSGQVRNAKRK